jgi:hypothetical protein
VPDGEAHPYVLSVVFRPNSASRSRRAGRRTGFVGAAATNDRGAERIHVKLQGRSCSRRAVDVVPSRESGR